MIFFDTQIVAINKEGIRLKKDEHEYFVDFQKCVSYSANRSAGQLKASVGSRDITKFRFSFCEGEGQFTEIVIRKKHLLDWSRPARFSELHKKIKDLGYSTFDAS